MELTMAYRNRTYVAFHAGNTNDPTKSDIRYYNTLKMWSASKHFDFQLADSHEKTSSIRDSSKRATLQRALTIRLKNSKQFFLILTNTTKNDTDWVPFEIAYAIDNCSLPIIAAYPNYTSIMDPSQLHTYWPYALKSRIENGSARVIHIPFKKEPVIDSIGQFDINNTKYPTDGYGYYNHETHKTWGLV